MRLSFLHKKEVFYVFTYVHEQCKLHFLFKSDGKTTQQRQISYNRIQNICLTILQVNGQ
jgi:hypothetical protein